MLDDFSLISKQKKKRFKFRYWLDNYKVENKIKENKWLNKKC